MLTIDCLSFDTEGWRLKRHGDGKTTWANEAGDKLGKQFFPVAPDLPSLFEIEALRDYFRRQASMGGGAIISVDVLHIKGMSMARALFKYPRPSGGVGYFGSLVIPYRDFSYVIRAQCVEIEGAPDREATVRPLAQQELPAGVKVSEVWLQDPYDPDFQSPMLRCLADDERWDSCVPDHPLSKIRAIFATIVPTISVRREVKNSVPFRGACL